LKDPRVQAAFEKANEKLDDRILEIDPTLKPYLEKRDKARTEGPSTAKTKTSSTDRHKAVAKKETGAQNDSSTHVVTKGETLSSIAQEYKVSVASLKAVNNITDERKLRTGQKLVIPSPKRTETQPGNDQSIWNRLKNSLD
jgi:LysM repeat protein